MKIARFAAGAAVVLAIGINASIAAPAGGATGTTGTTTSPAMPSSTPSTTPSTTTTTPSATMPTSNPYTPEHGTTLQRSADAGQLQPDCHAGAARDAECRRDATVLRLFANSDRHSQLELRSDNLAIRYAAIKLKKKEG
ncbi:MAG: hypothetical protein WDM89_10985 [Rhizomicrobium sp.]